MGKIVVVHEKDVGHRGMDILKVVPCPTRLSTEIAPPWASAKPLAMAKPKPVPS